MAGQRVRGKHEFGVQAALRVERGNVARIGFASVLALAALGCHVGYDPVDAGAAGPVDGGPPRLDASAGMHCDPSDACKRMRGGGCVTIDPPAGCTAMSCGGACYAFCPYALNWEGARTNCATAPGWCLAEIDNGLEDSCAHMLNGPMYTWIGLHQASGAATPADDWSWSCGGGAPMFANWYSQTDHDGVEDGQWQCGYIDLNGQWRDDDCTLGKPSICELP